MSKDTLQPTESEESNFKKAILEAATESEREMLKDIIALGPESSLDLRTVGGNLVQRIAAWEGITIPTLPEDISPTD
jgi:hypothetical protein